MVSHSIRNFLTPEIIERKSVPEPNSGCWLWLGCETGYEGYGSLQCERKTYRAHRASWIAYFGPIPDGMHVLHRCDNPACVNPRHLFLGTNKDNVDDKVRKGRQKGNPSPGEANGMSFLTTEDVKFIRASTETALALSRQFGVTAAMIGKIRRRVRWKHV